MKLDDVVARVRIHGDDALIRNGRADVDFIAQAVIEALGMRVADDGTVVGVAARPPAWEPPGGLQRSARAYRYGRGPRK